MTENSGAIPEKDDELSEKIAQLEKETQLRLDETEDQAKRDTILKAAEVRLQELTEEAGTVDIQDGAKKGILIVERPDGTQVMQILDESATTPDDVAAMLCRALTNHLFASIQNSVLMSLQMARKRAVGRQAEDGIRKRLGL